MPFGTIPISSQPKSPEGPERYGRRPWDGGRERSGNVYEKLSRSLREIATRLNQEFQRQNGGSDLVGPDCAISMPGFSEEVGGLYPAAEVARDTEFVRERDIENSGVRIPEVLAQRRRDYRQYQAVSEEEIVTRWKLERKKRKSGLMEMATLVLLHKMLGRDYLVVNTADYDDYHHLGGADNIIINRKTGEVVGAIDEVHEGARGEDLKNKQTKVENKVRKGGGVELKYGLSLDQGKLGRAHLREVPVFYLGLHWQELERLLAGMSYNPNGRPTAVEYEIFEKLLNSLEDQTRSLLDGPLSPVMISKIEKFQTVLANIRSARPQQKLAA